MPSLTGNAIFTTLRIAASLAADSSILFDYMISPVLTAPPLRARPLNLQPVRHTPCRTSRIPSSALHETAHHFPTSLYRLPAKYP